MAVDTRQLREFQKKPAERLKLFQNVWDVR